MINFICCSERSLFQFQCTNEHLLKQYRRILSLIPKIADTEINKLGRLNGKGKTIKLYF